MLSGDASADADEAMARKIEAAVQRALDDFEAHGTRGSARSAPIAVTQERHSVAHHPSSSAPPAPAGDARQGDAEGPTAAR
jgi:hypothetical protein